MFKNKYKAEVERLSGELTFAKEELKNLRREKDVIEEQRNGLVHERDELKEQRDIIAREKDVIEEQRNGLVTERDDWKAKSQTIEDNLKAELGNEKEVYLKEIREKQEYINYLEFDRDKMSELHEDLVMKNWNKTQSMKGLVCLYPFVWMDILTDGETFTCCSGNIKSHFSAGNIFKQDWKEIWNSVNARKLRYSVCEGNFEYCNRFCPYLHTEPQEKDTPFSIFAPLRLRKDWGARYDEYESCVLEQGPINLTVSCDPTCNLSCPSCRNCVKGLNKEESDRIYDVLINKVAPMLPTCKCIQMNGSGEVFASSAMSRFLKTFTKEKYPNLTVCLWTNGQLITREKWKEYSNLNGMDVQFCVSVDASEKQTYEEIRRGGKWEVLLENLEFISELVQSSKKYVLRMQFVVQKKNYTQIESFVEMARKYHASRVLFIELQNWGTVSTEEYLENDVLNPNHPERNKVMSILKKVSEYDDVIIGENIS